CVMVLRIKSSPPEQPTELLPNLDLVVAIARRKHLRPRRRCLLLDRRSGFLERNVERENRRTVWMQRRTIIAHDHRLPDVAREPELVAITRCGYAEVVHE